MKVKMAIILALFAHRAIGASAVCAKYEIKNGEDKSRAHNNIIQVVFMQTKSETDICGFEEITPFVSKDEVKLISQYLAHTTSTDTYKLLDTHSEFNGLFHGPDGYQHCGKTCSFKNLRDNNAELVKDNECICFAYSNIQKKHKELNLGDSDGLKEYNPETDAERLNVANSLDQTKALTNPGSAASTDIQIDLMTATEINKAPKELFDGEKINEQIPSFNVAYIYKLPIDKIKKLSADQLKAINAAVFDSLTIEQINALPWDQLDKIESEQIDLIDAEKFKNIDSGVISIFVKKESISDIQIVNLTKTQISELSTNLLTKLTKLQIIDITDNQIAKIDQEIIKQFSGEVLSGMTDVQFGQLSDQTIKSLSADQLNALTVDKIRIITAKQDKTLIAAESVKSLNDELIPGLSEEYIKHLNGNQLIKINAAAIRSIPRSTVVENYGNIFSLLDKDQITAIIERIDEVKDDYNSIENLDFTTDVIDNLTPKQIRFFSINKIKSLNKDTASKLTGNDISTLKQNQIESLTDDTLKSLSNELYTKIKTEHIKYFTVDQIKTIVSTKNKKLDITNCDGDKTKNAFVSGLVDEQLNTLPKEYFKCLTSEQLVQLSSERMDPDSRAWAYVKNKGGFLVHGLDKDDIGKIKKDHINKLTFDQLSVFKDDMLSKWDQEKINTLTAEQIVGLLKDNKTLKPLTLASGVTLTQNVDAAKLLFDKLKNAKSFNEIKPEEFNKLDKDLVKGLSSEAIKVIPVGTLRAANNELLNILNKKQIQAIATESIKNLNDKENNFKWTKEQINLMTSAQVEELHNKYMEYLSPSQIDKLSAERFKGITADVLKSMDKEGINKLERKQVDIFTKDQLQALDPTNISYLTTWHVIDHSYVIHTKDQIGMLTTPQILAMSPCVVPLLTPTRLNELGNTLNNFNKDQIQELTAEQLNGLSDTTVKLLSLEFIKSLSIFQMRKLNENFIKNMSNDRYKDLGERKFWINKEVYSKVMKDIITELKSEDIKMLSIEDVKKLFDGENLNKLKLDQFAWFTRLQISQLSIEELNKLNDKQLAKFTEQQINNIKQCDGDFIKKLPVDKLKDLSINVLTKLTEKGTDVLGDKIKDLVKTQIIAILDKITKKSAIILTPNVCPAKEEDADVKFTKKICSTITGLKIVRKLIQDTGSLMSDNHANLAKVSITNSLIEDINTLNINKTEHKNAKHLRIM